MLDLLDTDELKDIILRISDSDEKPISVIGKIVGGRIEEDCINMKDMIEFGMNLTDDDLNFLLDMENVDVSKAIENVVFTRFSQMFCTNYRLLILLERNEEAKEYLNILVQELEAYKPADILEKYIPDFPKQIATVIKNWLKNKNDDEWESLCTAVHEKFG